MSLATSNEHCGACNHGCDASSELCRAGFCESGLAGDDQCEGLADDVSITQISLFQTVELPLMKAGATSDPGIDVVTGKTTLAVAHIEPTARFVERELSARLLLEMNGEVQRRYSKNKLTPTGPTVNGQRSTWFEFDLPAGSFVEQTSYAIEIVNCGPAAVGERRLPRYPKTGYAPLGARDYGPLKITFVPIPYGSFLPDTSDATIQEYADAFRATYPVSSVQTVVRNVPTQLELPITDGKDWNGNLDLLRSLREADAAPSDVYYYGLIQPAASFGAFCQGSCAAGIGYVAAEDGRFEPAYRVAMGLGFLSDMSVRIAVHEVGHNHGRMHAPCAPGDLITGVDPSFPYAAGSIGVWGWDFRGDQLLHSPEWGTDIMGYCENQWVSDYTYEGLGAAVRSANGLAATSRSEVVDPEVVGDFRVLLVEAHRTRWRKPRPRGSVAFGRAEQAWVLDRTGAPLEAIQVYRVRLADTDAASFEVPAPKPGWYALQLAGVPAPIVFDPARDE